ncbi:MAG TPA: hypothetical protein VGK04_05895 [Thermoanaerobaculia bacterium]|jgi:hypothetical protein
MTQQLGRILQFIALLILPFGLGAGMLGNNIALEVRLLAIGGITFVLGWLLAKKRA